MAKINRIKDATETVTVSGSKSTWVVGKDVDILAGDIGIRDEMGSNNLRLVINGDVLTLGDAETVAVTVTGIGSSFIVGRSGSAIGDTGIALFGDDQVLTNRGAINGDEIGVIFHENNQVARNFGTITALSGAAVQFNDGAGNHFINEAGGEIVGVHSGVYAFSSQAEAARVTNHGTIEGGLAAVAFEDGDFFANDGMVKGLVLLGKGDDEADLRGGKVVGGYVYGDFGDDIYRVSNAVDIWEQGNQGDDTVLAYRSFTLNANAQIEHFKAMGKADLRLTGSNEVNEITGNAGDNRLSGLAGDDTLDGGKGRDVLTGGAENDFFIFGKGYGQDRITDFVTTGADEDEIDLKGFGDIDTFAEVKALAKNVGDNVVIDFGGGDRIVIEGVQVENLEADNFSYL